MSRRYENIKSEQQTPFATDGSSMFSKKFLIYSAIIIAIMTIIAFFNQEQFRDQVNNATFPWEISKDE